MPRLYFFVIYKSVVESGFFWGGEVVFVQANAMKVDAMVRGGGGGVMQKRKRKWEMWKFLKLRKRVKRKRKGKS